MTVILHALSDASLTDTSGNSGDPMPSGGLQGQGVSAPEPDSTNTGPQSSLAASPLQQQDPAIHGKLQKNPVYQVS